MFLPGHVLLLCGQEFKVLADSQSRLAREDDVIDKSSRCRLEWGAEGSLVFVLQGWMICGGAF